MGRNSLVIMALHMDAPIEIAWMVLGKLEIANLLSFPVSSMIAVCIEMVILDVAIWFVKKYTPFLLKYPKKINCEKYLSPR